MGTENIILLGTYLFVIIGLFFKKYSPAAVFGIGAFILISSGQLSASELLSTLTTPSLLILFLLLILAGTVQSRLGLSTLLLKYSKGKSQRGFLGVLLFPVALLSSIVNNTAIVAMLIGPIRKWAQRNGYSPSTFLMPLAFAATAGGMITVIGTSTNLVLNGLLEENKFKILHTADYILPGSISAITVILLMIFIAQKTIIKRNLKQKESVREYLVETRVLPNGDHEGKSVQKAGLRQVHGLYLAEIIRNQKIIAPVSPEELLEANDRLFFAGALEEVRELIESNPGLALPQSELSQKTSESSITEAMVPPGSNLVGLQIRNSEFRQRFDAAIIAIHRRGKLMQGRIGDNILEAGDLLLIISGPRNKEIIQTSKHLYGLNTTETNTPTKGIKRLLLIIGSIFSFVAYFLNIFDFLTLLLSLAATLAIAGWLTWEELKKHIDLKLMIVLSCAVSFSQVLMDSGLIQDWISILRSAYLNAGPFFWAILIFLITSIITNLMTNIAAVALVFPLAAAIIGSADPSLIENTEYSKVIFLSLAFGASNAFLTPIGYQTNLMIMGPGGYQTKDYLRFGIPVTVVYSICILTYFYVLVS